MYKRQDLNRVTIRNSAGDVLYSTNDNIGIDNEETRYWCTIQAQNGNDVFYSTFADGAFSSVAAAPIIINEKVSGTVYIYEYDQNQGAIMMSLQSNLKNISFILCIISVLLSIVSVSYTHLIFSCNLCGNMYNIF